MREVGVRELKARLSEALREVERGGQLRVTVHGRAVADIVPTAVGHDDGLRSLVAEGRLTLPSREHPRRAPRLARGTRPASALVLADRDEER
ncbi:MAG TPA: type II toxin-antitoxin system prevent-host-death family antitoxin [Conexibacter sp.]|nr:type II toxin-antitoxin system prevent-host-death family antitoxin [Conexibacter sp.]